ncbi:MAG: outer membrane beta-barrel protein [Burkholderiaceae bacterium]
MPDDNRPFHPDPASPRLCRRVVGALFATVTTLALADQGLVPYVTAIPRDAEASTVTFAVFQVERYDSNFFRLPDGTGPPGDTRRSVVTSTSGVGLNLDKSYGLQRIVVNASASRALYASYGNLDETSTRIDSKYYWSVTPSVTGDVTFDYSRIPTDYEYIGYRTAPNPRTTRLTRLNVDYKPGAALHPRLSFYESQDSTQDNTFQVESSRSHGVEASLLYDFLSGNVIGLYANHDTGKSLNLDPNVPLQLDSTFTQTQYGVLVSWKATGQTRLDGRIGYFERGGQRFTSRNYDGLVGTINFRYDLTGKSVLRIQASRNLYASQTIFSSYYQENLGEIGVDWAATGKLTFRPKFGIRKQDFRGSPFPVVDALTETTRYGTLQLDYAALRAVDLAFSISRSSRTSNNSALQFTDNNASAFVRFKF